MTDARRSSVLEEAPDPSFAVGGAPQDLDARGLREAGHDLMGVGAESGFIPETNSVGAPAAAAPGQLAGGVGALAYHRRAGGAVHDAPQAEVQGRPQVLGQPLPHEAHLAKERVGGGLLAAVIDQALVVGEHQHPPGVAPEGERPEDEERCGPGEPHLPGLLTADDVRLHPGVQTGAFLQDRGPDFDLVVVGLEGYLTAGHVGRLNAGSAGERGHTLGAEVSAEAPLKRLLFPLRQ